MQSIIISIATPHSSPARICLAFKKNDIIEPYTQHFGAYHNFSLETLTPNLVALSRPSLQILDKTLTVVFLIYGRLIKPLINKIVITPQTVMILT